MLGHSGEVPAMNQEEGPHQNVTILAPWSWTFQPPELWEINFCCLEATRFVAFCYSSLNGLRHTICYTLPVTVPQLYPEPISRTTWRKIVNGFSRTQEEKNILTDLPRYLPFLLFFLNSQCPHLFLVLFTLFEKFPLAMLLNSSKIT